MQKEKKVRLQKKVEVHKRLAAAVAVAAFVDDAVALDFDGVKVKQEEGEKVRGRLATKAGFDPSLPAGCLSLSAFQRKFLSSSFSLFFSGSKKEDMLYLFFLFFKELN